jgi:hypothetical protein
VQQYREQQPFHSIPRAGFQLAIYSCNILGKPVSYKQPLNRYGSAETVSIICSGLLEKAGAGGGTDTWLRMVRIISVKSITTYAAASACDAQTQALLCPTQQQAISSWMGSVALVDTLAELPECCDALSIHRACD